ncbi:peptidylprolyl isomerase [Cognatishimia sp.]|uniref:peptidylprolyl isomerase n=1 Tax=Cognatishimia sp. TaxID=2211648 RepID=UPI00351309D4
MSKTLKALRISAASVFLAAPVFAQETPTAETVVATVNNTEITLGHMIAVRESLPQQYQSLQPSVLFSGILDQIIQQTLLAQTIGDDIPTRAAKTLEVQRTAILADVAVDSVIAGRVDDAALQAAYDAKYGNFVGTPEFDASHILVETQEEAQAIATEIRAGADFAETAIAKSTGPSGPRGGALGWFGPGQMVPQFEAAVAALNVGEVSDPVETQFGWHVIILNDKRTQEAPTLEQVRQEIQIDAENAAASAYVAELRDVSVIDESAAEALDPNVIAQFDLLDD